MRTKRTRALLWCLTLLSAGLIALGSFYLDPAVQTWIVQHKNEGTQNLMRAVSRLGDWPTHIVVGLVLLAVAWRIRNKKWIRTAFTMIVACAIAGAVVRAAKISVGRARPSIHAESAWNGPSMSSRYHSFPSGHTAASTAFFASLVFASWRIGVPTLLVPFLIAFSRMYVAAHYLSDVVCAMLIGLLAAYLSTVWIQRIDPIQDRTSKIEN